MVKVIKNPFKIKCKVKSFVPTLGNDSYFKKITHTNLSNFINKAIAFYILLINDPKRVMIELKTRYPDLWKKINQRKF